MTKLSIYFLTIEVTRRCNIKCGICMRGDAQNINIQKNYIDALFDLNNKDYKFHFIDNICFTGGEPTLYPEIIIYTINKIIDEELPVKNLSMVTNGQIFIPELVVAFNKFNKYSNIRQASRIRKEWANMRELIDEFIIANTNGHVTIALSTDVYHAPISEKIKSSYCLLAEGLKVIDKTIKEEDIIKSGYADFGKELKPHEGLYSMENDLITFYENLYLTAKGELLFGGDGSYEFLDSQIIGNVEEDSIERLVRTRGKNIFLNN